LKEPLEEIKRIRTQTAGCLRSGGSYLVATGLLSSHGRFGEHEEMMASFGLERLPAESAEVWDPYGIDGDLIKGIRTEADLAKFGVTKDNSLWMYRKG
jgi:hypothetical protein